MAAQVAIDHDALEQIARAVLGQISPLTGTRGTGAILVTNETAEDVALPKNMYLLPNVGTLGELADDLVFKTSPNPDTLEEHGQGGDWTIPASGTLEVAIRSNLGGLRHNLPEGTSFRFDPPVPGLALTAELVADITDAEDRDESVPRLQTAIYYEELDSARIAKDLAGGRLAHLPGVFICWEQSTPAEGRTAGTNQGSTRADADRRFFAEHFRLYVVVAEHSSDRLRRSSGTRILQAITRLLTDQVVTTDWEVLTSLGSLEILSRSRFTRGERHYVYQLAFRVNRVFARRDNRVFGPWLLTRVVADAPGREDPEPTEPFEMADVTFENPPGPDP